jgi:tetratricopeptide (TPR) repeat protein
MEVNMFRSRTLIPLLAACLLVSISSCVTVKFDENIANYRATIQRLEAKLTKTPNDFESLQELGVIYFQTKQYLRATDYLRNALSLKQGDSKTLFYLGMSLEFQGNTKSALAVFLNYTDVSSLSPYRKLMEGRYRALTRAVIQQQVQSLLAREHELGEDAMSPKTVAVFPFAYQGTDDKFSGLGMGLGEMVIIDLGQVKGLTLVERIRIDAVLDELKFGQSKSVDPATAPRVGKILTAGRIVTGSFDVSKSNQLQLNAAFYDVPNRKFPDAVSHSGELDNMFRLEKGLVFDVIAQMGIRLTPVEREKIQRIPTKSLQAFLAYSKGLEKENAGDYQAASTFFRQSVTLDPNFAPAKGRAEAADALTVAGGGGAIAAAQKIDPPIRPEFVGTVQELVSDRFSILVSSLGSNFIPGEDNRKPADEAARTTKVKLPNPPRPPGQ